MWIVSKIKFPTPGDRLDAAPSRMMGRALASVLRQFVFGIALAVLIGPHDLFGWLSLRLVVVSIATIPTSQLLFVAFGYIGMLGLGAAIVAVMLYVVDPLHALHLSLIARGEMFAAVIVALVGITVWFRYRGRLD
jgi:hypothetical protein